MLDFQESKFLKAVRLTSPICITIPNFNLPRHRDFLIFKMAAVAIGPLLDFLKFEILVALAWRVSICVIIPNFVVIGQTIAEI